MAEVTGLRARERRRLQWFRAAVLVAVGLFIIGPLLSLVEFSTRQSSISGPRTLEYWGNILNGTGGLVDAIVASLELAALTSLTTLALLVPTMVWVRLRVPAVTRLVEFCCLLPLTIPAIVLVVGLFPVYAWVWYLLSFVVGQAHKDSILTLFFAYVIIVLPYAYRALDTGLQAMDVRTLSEAARSLGAGWGTVIWRVVVPNMAGAVLNTALLCVALVMGEYTIASLFNYVNLQVAVAQLGLSDAGTSIAVSAASLAFAFLLLVVLSLVGRRAGRRTS